MWQELSQCWDTGASKTKGALPSWGSYTVQGAGTPREGGRGKEGWMGRGLETVIDQEDKGEDQAQRGSGAAPQLPYSAYSAQLEAHMAVEI